MNVKSMLVGFLIAVVASTGTYFLVPPPRDADAAFGGLSVKELFDALKTCEVSQVTGTISCKRHRFFGGYRNKRDYISNSCSRENLQLDRKFWTEAKNMTREKCMKHYEP